MGGVDRRKILNDWGLSPRFGPFNVSEFIPSGLFSVIGFRRYGVVRGQNQWHSGMTPGFLLRDKLPAVVSGQKSPHMSYFQLQVDGSEEG